MLVSLYEWEAIEDTEFWRSQPGIHDDIDAMHGEMARGEYVTADVVLADARRRVADAEERSA